MLLISVVERRKYNEARHKSYTEELRLKDM